MNCVCAANRTCPNKTGLAVNASCGGIGVVVILLTNALLNARGLLGERRGTGRARQARGGEVLVDVGVEEALHAVDHRARRALCEGAGRSAGHRRVSGLEQHKAGSVT